MGTRIRSRKRAMTLGSGGAPGHYEFRMYMLRPIDDHYWSVRTSAGHVVQLRAPANGSTYSDIQCLKKRHCFGLL